MGLSDSTAPGGRSRSPGDSPVREPWTQDASVVARSLAVDPETGLTTAEAERRLERDGPNELRERPPVPLWRRALAQFREPLVLVLLVAVAISTLVWLADGAEGWPVDSIVIVVIVVLNAVLGLVQETRAAQAVAALREMTAAGSTVLRDGRLSTVTSSDLVRGDVLVLSEGDAVGADARLLSANVLRIDEASLTGESEPVTKDVVSLPSATVLGDRRDMVHRGTAVTQGVGRAVVTATGMETQVGAIAALLDSTESSPSPLQREVTFVSKALGLTVIAIAVVAMITISVVNRVSGLSDAITVLLFGVSLAVAAVPEGLPAILSVVLALGVQRLARRHAVVKRLTSVETLGSASVICSDKTGTLTRNEMTIQCVVTASGRVDVSGVGYRPEGAISHHGRPLTDELLAHEVQVTLGGGRLANNAQLHERDDGVWEIQGDPTEAAFLVAARKYAPALEYGAEVQRIGEIPFSSERKRMSVLVEHAIDGRRFLLTKGAPDVVVELCSHILVGEEVRPIDETRRSEVRATIEALSAQALRTLAVAFRPVGDAAEIERESGVVDQAAERGLVYAGVVGILDPPRDEVATAVAEAQRAGIRVVMITGDHPATATRIAVDLGIAEPGAPAVTGAEIEALDDAGLRDIASRTSVFARVAPEHKLRIVDGLQAQGLVVAMTGDGVNDAPALRRADIGVAMAITGTEVTKEAGDVILGDDDFATIVSAVSQGRAIFDNIRKFLRYLLSSNMGEVFTVFFGVAFAGAIGLTAASAEQVVLPLLATQILWINLVTDSGPALAMGLDPQVDDVMGRPPRAPDDRIIDHRMWSSILWVGLVMAVASLLAMDLFLPGGLIEGSDDFDLARTAGFTTLVLAQFFNALNARSARHSAFTSLFANPWLWGAIAVGVLLQIAVVELPALQHAFGTVSLEAHHWLVCVALASMVLWCEEARKWVWRSRHG